MELQTAREIFGVQKSCTLKKLDERLAILTREYLGPTHLEDIHKAYQVIHAHITKQETNSKEPLRKQADNFFYHYKYHVIFGLLSILLAGCFIYTIINNQFEKTRAANKPSSNIEIMIFGDYENEDLFPLEKRIKDLFPDWEYIDIELVYAPVEVSSQEDMAATQKNKVTMKTETPDIYILDLHHFNKFVENGPFLPLNQYGITRKVEDDPLFYQREDDGQEYVYGIDLTENKLFSGLKIATDEKIAVIHLEPNNKENALALLSRITGLGD